MTAKNKSADDFSLAMNSPEIMRTPIVGLYPSSEEKRGFITLNEWETYRKPTDALNLKECVEIDEINAGSWNVTNRFLENQVFQLLAKLNIPPPPHFKPVSYVKALQDNVMSKMNKDLFVQISAMAYVNNEPPFHTAVERAEKIAYEKAVLMACLRFSVDISHTAHAHLCGCSENKWNGIDKQCKSGMCTLKWVKSRNFHFLTPHLDIEVERFVHAEMK